MSEMDGPPVTVKIRLVTAEGSGDVALRTFRSLVGRVRGQPGCISCRLFEDVHEPAELTFTQKWRSRRDLERYVCSVEFPQLLAGIDLAAEQPEVEVRTASGLHGLDYFEEVLSRFADSSPD